MSTDPKSKGEKLNDLRSQLDRLGYGGGAKRGGAVFSAEELRRKIRRKPESRPRKKPEPQPLKKPPASGAILYQRDLPRRQTARRESGADSGRKVVLEEAVAGFEMAHQPRGKAFVVSTQAGNLEGAASLGAAFKELLADDHSRLCRRLAPVCEPSEVGPADVIFLDVESTGLGSSPLFLVGVMVWGADGFEVRQYLARNYAEEAAVIGLFLELCAPKKLLVTFNGKSFDFPFIRSRAAANGLPFDLAPAHFDLLHECRRVWKAVLPNCKLQTLEKYVCRRARYGDIPGSEIPDAYHAFVRTDNAGQMVQILRHNMLDLVTLAELMTKLPAPPEKQD